MKRSVEAAKDGASTNGDGRGKVLDVLVVGGGQAGLAAGYYLRCSGLSFAILDAAEGPGGAWRHGWDSLTAFSPARYSSLPGRMMPGGEEDYPTRDEVVGYLADYEGRYGLPVQRSVRVEAVERRGELLAARVGPALVKARAVVSATGTWSEPFVPGYPGRERFRGEQVHSAFYRSPEPYRVKKVLVVGGGNSAAQILAEVSRVAAGTAWATLGEPRFRRTGSASARSSSGRPSGTRPGSRDARNRRPTPKPGAWGTSWRSRRSRRRAGGAY